MRGCHGVESLLKALKESQTSCLQSVCISDCSLPVTLPSGCLPNTLTELKIVNCEKLEFPIHLDSLKTSLEKVHISKSCSGSLVFFPLDFFPNISHLHIDKCENLESLTVSDRLLCHGLTRLSYLCISGCPKFVSFPEGGLHAPNLTHLIVMVCKKLKKLSEQMHNLLPSLECLRIIGCPLVESFPEGGLPSNLAQLTIVNCCKLTARRMMWNLQKLPALTLFSIGDEFEGEGGGGVESFPEGGLLPATLTHLSMDGLASVKSLNIKALQPLTCLTFLRIASCPQLQNLPQQKLPTSLTILYIEDCPILKERCQRVKGQDWSKISHIHSIKIDYEPI